MKRLGPRTEPDRKTRAKEQEEGRDGQEKRERKPLESLRPSPVPTKA